MSDSSKGVSRKIFTCWKCEVQELIWSEEHEAWVCYKCNVKDESPYTEGDVPDVPPRSQWQPGWERW